MIRNLLLLLLRHALFRAWLRISERTATVTDSYRSDPDCIRAQARDLVRLQVQEQFDNALERVWKAHLAGLVGVAEREARLASWWAGVGARAGEMTVTGVGR